MWRVVVSLLILCPPALAQTPAGDDADARVEAFLAERSLEGPLAAHLRRRLSIAAGDERKAVAEALGRIYAGRLERAGTPEERREWEARARELMDAVPESQMFELRILLSKPGYLHAEQIVERWRARMAGPEDAQEAERILRGVLPIFEEVSSRSVSIVETLERREAQAAGSEDEPRVRESLADARRARSLAMYYAAWSNYYLGLLTRSPAPAAQSLAQFGWLLNSAGRPASVERLPRQLLRYEHVARAALGCALAEAARGNDDTALRWLDALAESPETDPGVRGQLFLRRVDVLASSRRWADLELVVRRERERSAEPLATLEARLLAIRMLDALETGTLREPAGVAARALAEGALADLVARGEIRHVLELVQIYGTLPIGEDGFIVHYVRGLTAYDRAREAHKALGSDPDEPAGDAGVANAYREAIASLDIALASTDRESFPRERTNAGLLVGLSAYYAGLFESAARHLEAAHLTAATPEQGEEALWLATVALDRAVEAGSTILTDRRDRASQLFLASYPRSERAARLLLRRAGLMTDDRAAQVLLDVASDSPLYEAARRQASTLLYKLYRAAAGEDREFAAARFLGVAREVLSLDAARVQEARGEDATKAAQAAIARVRQVLDVSLGQAAPDVTSAEAALQTLAGIAADVGLDLDELEPEIEYRRLQIALARLDTAAIDAAIARLASHGGDFAVAGDRLLYRHAVESWARSPDDPGVAREVVRHGARLIAHYGSTRDALGQAAVASLHNSVAEAAAGVYRRDGDEAMRDVALRLDDLVLANSTPSRQTLRRFAEMAESAGRASDALEAWRALLSGLTARQDGWFEARYHSIRLLAEIDPPRARETLDQHRALYPSLGPEPWGDLLRELDETIPRRGEESEPR